MTQQTAKGITYPESTDHVRTWEHWQQMAEDIDGLITVATGEAEDATTTTVTSTSFTDSSGGPFAATIVVPPSGTVIVNIRSTQRNSTTNNTITHFSASGSVSGSVYGASTVAALIVRGTDNLSFSLCKRLTGLSPGETLTVTMLHRVNTTSTGTMDYRHILLEGTL
ncbi:hypothetical protein OG393_31080 [Streptomyces sp. NBC_01216]|uniref:hypothetical protein n=1 Tax=Streptomyces sp. NBC_01216 TaxID=2903778 RepID=UPI002E0E38BE|nr:hypothetical protein OG393_31080 [Streptomyces sp. NBC_01216]